MNETNLGQIVKSIRLSNVCDAGHLKCGDRLSQNHIAGLLYMNPATISMLERNKKVSHNAARSVCDLFDIELDDYEDSTNLTREVVRIKVDAFDGAPSLNDFYDLMCRFRVDVLAAREVMLCNEGCCKNTMSRKHCGKLFNIGTSNWRNIEVGTGMVRLELFLAICKYFGMNPLDYIGPSVFVASGGGDISEALNWLAANRGRLAFDVGDESLQVFVSGYTPCYGDTIVEAVAWMKRKIDVEKKGTYIDDSLR